MATYVGTTVGVASVTRTLTVGNGATYHSKWENGATPSASFTSGGNTWTLQQSVLWSPGNQPGSAFYTCLSITTGGSIVTTPTFSAGSPTFQHGEIIEFTPTAGQIFALDVLATAVQGTGTGAGFTYNAVSATASAAGFAVFGVSDFNTITYSSAGGTPAFTVQGAVFNGDSFSAFAVTSSGSVAPSVSASGGTTQWIQQLILVKETPANPTAIAWLTA